MDVYHVLNRGVEKRNIVKDDSDRLRFVHDLFVFNDTMSVDPNHRSRGFISSRSDKKEIVLIHAWCLMDNHYHILLSPLDGNLENLSLFMKKLNMGYAKYFNERHGRTGVLWQGKYKKVHISGDSQFTYIPYYIHLNPLDHKFPQWRKGSVKNFQAAMAYLDNYRWSSHLDYLYEGRKNFPSLISKKLLKEQLGTARNYKSEIANVISSVDTALHSQLIE